MQDLPLQTQPADRLNLDVASLRGGNASMIATPCWCFSDEVE